MIPPYTQIMLWLFFVPTFIMWLATMYTIIHESQDWSKGRKRFLISTVAAFAVSVLMALPLWYVWVMAAH